MRVWDIFFVVLLITLAAGQNLPFLKPGECPPPIASQFCVQSCEEDYHCPGLEKCCKTYCGGTLCVFPVTVRSAKLQSEKPGLCPAKPTGAWVCSNTCSFDSDCRGRAKCCRGRCPGSMSCQKPEY